MTPARTLLSQPGMTTQQFVHGGREKLDEWETLEERLGLPGNPRAHERAAELTAEGWQLLGVLFQSGVWRFRRLKLDSG